MSFFTCVVFVLFCARTNFVWWTRTWRLALGVWLMVPIPALLTEYQWFKMHPLSALSNAVGWLVKLMACAVASAWLLS